MKRERRKFTREFKLYAVELSYTSSSIAELASELKVRPELLYRWRSELRSLLIGMESITNYPFRFFELNM